MSRLVTGGRPLPEHIFKGVCFGPMSELGKFYIDFTPLGNGKSMVMPILQQISLFFDHFQDWSYKTHLCKC